MTKRQEPDEGEASATKGSEERAGNDYWQWLFCRKTAQAEERIFESGKTGLKYLKFCDLGAAFTKGFFTCLRGACPLAAWSQETVRRGGGRR